MKTSPLALAAVLSASSSPTVTAFAPSPAGALIRGGGAVSTSAAASSIVPLPRSVIRLNMAGFLGQDSSSTDDDDEGDDDDDATSPSSLTPAESSMYANLKLDPWDPNPPIKPRPGRYGFKPVGEETIPDDQLVQTMTPSEREENLNVMRQIKNNDLPDLRLRKDHAGWLDANNDLTRREKKDPWYALNDRLAEAIQLDDDAEATYLRGLIEKVGGPPPQVTVGPRGYALHTEIFAVPMSPQRAAAQLERQVMDERMRRGRAMAAERRKNEEKAKRRYEDTMANPGVREDKEAAERRERMMAKLLGELEEDKKKKEEWAKEVLGQLPDDVDQSTYVDMDRVLKEARDDVKRMQQARRAGKSYSAFDIDDAAALEGADDAAADATDEDKPMSKAAKARAEAMKNDGGGRPRLPGDTDVTRGEIDIAVEESSSTTTGPLTVEVSSSYNKDQSDPPMRKHCFQYTIRITNNSEADTVQLLSRRFEIQTVGSSMKDVVQGEGVTGRQPILKPGEVFEYTSTAPLSVRPIGTTEIAARMKGEYKYVTLSAGQETATDEQVKAGGDASAELGMFHFVFPEEQRVKPVRPSDDDDDDDDDEEEDEAPTATAEPMASAPTPAASTPASTSAVPASTLPGDADMTSGTLSMTSVTDASDTTTDGVRVQVTSTYRPERSQPSVDKHCFAYNIRITNDSTDDTSVQLVSRRFEIQTIGSENKDVVQGPGVTGRQPILKPGESFEYTSTAPLNVKPMLDKTPVVARMEGEYNFVKLGDDGSTPLSSEPLKAKLGMFHFILPALEGV